MRFNESQHFYSYVSDTDKVPRRSTPFHNGPPRAAGLSLLAERSVVLLADRMAGDGPRFMLPVTLRAYGGQMLRRLGQDQEFAARHKRWQDDRRPHQGSLAGK